MNFPLYESYVPMMTTNVARGSQHLNTQQTQEWLRVHLAKWALITRAGFSGPEMSIKAPGENAIIDFRIPLSRIELGVHSGRATIDLIFEGYAAKRTPKLNGETSSTIYDDAVSIEISSYLSKDRVMRLMNAIARLSETWAQETKGNKSLFGA
jgi:hypothetical protein